jgi:hypothetical protein
VTYLGFPRLHFCGSFQADPSTVNNDPYHFDMAAFRPGWQQPGPGATKGWWNPDGTAAWRLSGCSVRSVAYADGSLADEPWDDPVIGMAVNSATQRVAAKLVDLDTEQQMVSQIWGLQVELGELGAPNAFSGEFEVAAFADIWVRFPAGQPDSFFSATYQSVLTGLDWSDKVDSPLLEQFGGAERLSIKFTVDGFDDDRDSPRFTLGRISGAIGPCADGEPHHLVAGRLMRPPATAPQLNFAPFRIDGNRLLVDLANSLPTTAVGGPQQDVGRLEVALLPAGAPPVPIGVVNYLRPGWYEDRAGIEAFTLTPDQAVLAAQTPVGVVRRSGSAFATLLSEDPNGTFVRADRFVFRLDPGVPDTTTLYATRFGVPAADQRIDLVVDNTVMEQQQTQGVGHGTPVGVPDGVLEFPDHVTTGPLGTAEVTLEGSDPGNARGYIDGQVYGVRFDWDGADLSAYAPDTMSLLSVLLWTAYEVPDEPTWMDDVHPILHQYAELYPVMRRVLDLDDYHSVVSNADSLQYVFSRPLTDPNYMPVVRDLSTAKRETMLKWLRAPHPPYMRTATLGDLQRALQQAIELEHSTIPPYLTALFSIKDGHNRAVAEIIRSVVIEEMLHMALACNLLNAIGGEPRIGVPGFVPQYPSKLPGGLRPDLTVSLRKASIEQIQHVFMGIEEPEETSSPRARHALTIGWFYEEIKRGLKTLHDEDPKLFERGDPARQVSGWRGPGELFAVSDLKTAKRAIREITDQGEGTSPIDPADGYDEIAHFYRFEEIVRGRRIVLEKDGYSFTGPEVRFDPDGVWPMIDDPSPSKLPAGSLVQRRSDQFDDLYWSLLAVLHEAFNGRPERLDSAIELMFSLEVAAKKLVATPLAPGAQQTAGPAFRDPRPLPASAELPTDATTRRKPLTMKGQPAPH